MLDDSATPQAPQGVGLAITPSALDLPFHSDFRFVAQCGREFLLQDDPPTRPPRCSDRLPIGRLPSTPTWPSTMPNAKRFAWTKTAEAILAKLDRLPVSSVCVWASTSYFIA
jgi:hypothetical protein